MDIEALLEFMQKSKETVVKIGKNILLQYVETTEDTLNGKREIYIIERKLSNDKKTN